jgi:hypothetical protein
MATNPRHTERESTTDSTSETRKAAEQSAQNVRNIGDATERTTRAGAATFQRNAESASKVWQNGGEGAARIAQRSTEQLSKMLGLSGATVRDAVQQTSENLQAVAESTSIMAGGLQDVAGEWMRFAQERVEQNLDHLDRLGQCRTLHDCLTLQAQILRDNVEAFLQSTQRTCERSTQIAGTAIRHITESAPAAH